MNPVSDKKKVRNEKYTDFFPLLSYVLKVNLKSKRNVLKKCHYTKTEVNAGKAKILCIFLFQY